MPCCPPSPLRLSFLSTVVPLLSPTPALRAQHLPPPPRYRPPSRARHPLLRRDAGARAAAPGARHPPPPRRRCASRGRIEPAESIFDARRQQNPSALSAQRHTPPSPPAGHATMLTPAARLAACRLLGLASFSASEAAARRLAPSLVNCTRTYEKISEAHQVRAEKKRLLGFLVKEAKAACEKGKLHGESEQIPQEHVMFANLCRMVLPLISALKPPYVHELPLPKGVKRSWDCF
ncbi:hypothetical protein C2845_PM06G30760 [Panicum miliaceum]|uniref:Uncharacterized protein n=1 Tax=Panicum miliaceum TaxID=4540 RepID=A0A3L6RC64_PANMI|nr:hypothetical protein C2845_PM06G30760 [Panicum miliaceum]